MQPSRREFLGLVSALAAGGRGCLELFGKQRRLVLNECIGHSATFRMANCDSVTLHPSSLIQARASLLSAVRR